MAGHPEVLSGLAGDRLDPVTQHGDRTTPCCGKLAPLRARGREDDLRLLMRVLRDPGSSGEAPQSSKRPTGACPSSSASATSIKANAFTRLWGIARRGTRGGTHRSCCGREGGAMTTAERRWSSSWPSWPTCRPPTLGRPRASAGSAARTLSGPHRREAAARPAWGSSFSDAFFQAVPSRRLKNRVTCGTIRRAPW